MSEVYFSISLKEKPKQDFNRMKLLDKMEGKKGFLIISI